jgi:hypothetical protein
MSTLTVNDIKVINFQDDVDSEPLRTNYENLKNAINDNQSQISAISTAASGNEVVLARDNADSLKDRLNNSEKPMGNVVVSGLQVTEQTVPNMTVQVSAGYAIVNGILCYKSASSNSNTVTAPTNERYDVVVINTDNTLTIVLGNDSADPVLPAIANSQRPLAILKLDSSTTSLNNGVEIIDASEQGCIVDNSWYWKIQEAIDTLDDRTNMTEQGTVIVRKGDYYEEISLNGISNVEIRCDNGVNIFRISDTNYCIKSINTVSNETTGNKIFGGYLKGNGKAGSLELLKFEYTDDFMINGTRFDAYENSAASTAAHPNFNINQCDKIRLENIMPYDVRGEVNNDTYIVQNTTEGYERAYDTGWINTNDWSNRQLGQVEIDYDGLSGTFLIGELVTETGGNACTGVIVADTGSKLTLKDVTASGIFADDNVITGSVSGATADVNEVAGNNKNVDTNITHGFNENLSGLLVQFLISTDGTDNNSEEIAPSISLDGANEYGFTIFQVNINTIQIQTTVTGLYDTNGSITTSDWYYKIKIIKKNI